MGPLVTAQHLAKVRGYIDAGDDHDARTFGGLNNALRLALRELGMRETKPKPIPTIAEIAARHRSEGA